MWKCPCFSPRPFPPLGLDVSHPVCATVKNRLNRKLNLTITSSNICISYLTRARARVFVKLRFTGETKKVFADFQIGFHGNVARYVTTNWPSVSCHWRYVPRHTPRYAHVDTFPSETAFSIWNHAKFHSCACASTAQPLNFPRESQSSMLLSSPSHLFPPLNFLD